jgi:hypothetical protein
LGIEADGSLNAEARDKTGRCQAVEMLRCHPQHLGEFVHLQCRGPLLDLFQYRHEFLLDREFVTPPIYPVGQSMRFLDDRKRKPFASSVASIEFFAETSSIQYRIRSSSNEICNAFGINFAASCL